MTTEQTLKTRLEQSPTSVVVFATGCYLIPFKLNNGKWGWVVSSFEDGTYFDGEEVNVNGVWSDNPTDLVGEPYDIDPDDEAQDWDTFGDKKI